MMNPNMEESNISLFTCLLKGQEIYYKCLVENDNGYEPISCCSYLNKGIKGIVEHLNTNHGISSRQNIDFHIIKESDCFTINESTDEDNE